MKTSSPFRPPLLAAFNRRMVVHALGHQEQFAARTGTILAGRGLLKDVREEEAAPELPALIAQVDHPGRVRTPDGPLLFYRPEDGSASITLIDMPELLLHPKQPVRAATVEFFRRLGSAGLLCKRAISVFDQLAGLAGSAGEKSWQTAAVALFDVVEDDYLLSLAGIRQSLAVGHNETFTKFLRRTLFPSLPCVDALGAEVVIVSGQMPEAARRIEEMSQSCDSLPSLCAMYFETFGHVPLAPPFSLARAVSLWQQGKDRAGLTASGEWPEVWSWVETNGSPLARYHALSLLGQRPDLVSAEFLPGARDELLTFLAPLAENSQSSPAWLIALSLRNAAAAHYVQYLNGRLPPAPADMVGEWAWWMAEHFCACLGTDARLMEHVLRSAVQPASRISAYESSLVPTRLGRSNLSHATLFADHLWALALLTGMSGKGMAALAPTFSETQAEQWVKCFHQHLLVALPTSVDEGPAVFAVDNPLSSAAKEWHAASGAIVIGACVALSAENDRRLNPDVLFGQLEKLLSLSPDEQLSTILTLRLLMATGCIPEERLLARISNLEWLSGAMHRLEPQPCEGLLAALCMSKNLEDESWSRWLMQLAILCEQSTLSTERCTLIFSSIVSACAVSARTSPIARLLNGPQRDQFAPTAAFCRKKLEAAYPTCSQAVKSTIRSITSVLPPP